MSRTMTSLTICAIWTSFTLYVISGVDVVDVEVEYHEKECYGSSMGFSFSGTRDFHYESLHRRYSGCTHVIGNLEITNLNEGNKTYDLGFLATIKVVTGYVLLGLLNTETIPLTSLRLIRADTTLQLGRERYGLVVVLNSWGKPTKENPTPGLRELQLPLLKEITFGNVLFTQNPWLCHIHTIDWDVITPFNVKIKDSEDEKCKPCQKECVDEHGVSRCWASGPDMCQSVDRVDCDFTCPGRCFKPGMFGCCHAQCAVGCFGSSDRECMMCRYFQYQGQCIPECPQGTYPLGQNCVEF